MTTNDADRSERELAAVQAMYASDRADGSAIYSVSIQIVGIMVAYAAVAFAVLGYRPEALDVWVRAFVAIPLWGLAAYLTIVNALMSVRTMSIKALESELQKHFPSQLQHRLLGSDLGDWATGARQPVILQAVTVLSFTAAFSGVLGLSWYSVSSVRSDVGNWSFGLLIFFYLALSGLILTGFLYATLGMLAGKAKRQRV